MTVDALRAAGVEAVADDGIGFRLRAADRDWLRVALVSLGYTSTVRGDELCVRSKDGVALSRAVRAALRPEALLFDLDGVLADLMRRTCLVDPADVAALAAVRPLGVVTTCPRRLADSVLERYGLAASFAAVVTADDGPGKPDPFPVRLALQRLGAEAAWMLGDNPSDVTAARGAGVVPFAVAPRGIGAESHADRLRAAGAARLVDGVAAFRALVPPVA